MLANAIATLVLLSLIVATILGAGMAATRATISRLSSSAEHVGYERALDTLVQRLGSFAQAGSFPNPLPTVTPLPIACADAANPCAYSTTENIVFSDGDSSAVNEEANPYVSETHFDAWITVNVFASDQTLLASRSHAVELRITSAPPYVTIAGAAGNDSGAPPATPNPCAPASPGSTDDTVIRVAYQNVQTGACSNGSIWK